MIISASYKTDIPAFYGSWFMNRLRAGYCMMTQPFNRRTIRVSLLPEDVDGFVFWTKNIGPFVKHLPAIATVGRRFMVQYTINGYPRELETAVVNPEQSVGHIRRLAADYGPKVCVWRYDPVLLTSLTDLDFHRRNFGELARKLAGSTDEVVISFAHFYRKTNTNLRRASEVNRFSWQDPSAEVKKNLCAQLSDIAGEHGIGLSICAQPEFQEGQCSAAKCIDADRLAAIVGKPILAKTKGNRPDCLCHECRDIGEYDTCPHGCVYCYAVQNHVAAVNHYRNHDEDSEFLFTPKFAKV